MKPASHQEREHFQHSRKIPSPPFPSAPPTPPTESCRQGRVVPLLALNVAGLPQWGPGRGFVDPSSPPCARWGQGLALRREEEAIVPSGARRGSLFAACRAPSGTGPCPSPWPLLEQSCVCLRRTQHRMHRPLRDDRRVMSAQVLPGRAGGKVFRRQGWDTEPGACQRCLQ